MFGRVIDVGCGRPGDVLARLPPFRTYIGIDVDDYSLAEAFRIPAAEFVQADAIEVLGDIDARNEDLIVSFFSAHHVGTKKLFEFLSKASDNGAEFLVVDASLSSARSFWAHYLSSIIRALAGILTATLLGRWNVRWLMGKHLRFLLSANGCVHARLDYSRGLQSLPSLLPGGGVIKTFGALWSAHHGNVVSKWLET